MPEERGDPLLRQYMENLRASGKIPNRFANSMRDHQKNVDKLAQKPKRERLRSKFDFDLWGEKGNNLLCFMISQVDYYSTLLLFKVTPF